MKTPTGSPYQQSPHPHYPPTVPLYVYRELTKELKEIQAKLDMVTSQNHKLAQENKLLRQEFNQVVKSCLELQKLLAASQPTSSSSPSIPRVAYNSQLLDEPINNAPIRPEINYPELNYPTPTTPTQQSIPTSNTTPNNTSDNPTPSPILPDAPHHRKIRTKPPVKPVTPPPSGKKTKPPKKRPQTFSVPPMDINSPPLENSENISIQERVSNSTENDSVGLHTGWLILIIMFVMVTGFSAGYLVVRPLLQSQSQSK